jgi:hypothetical protein
MIRTRANARALCILTVIMTSAQPWDPPPSPKRGNRSRRVLFEAIGRALATWEEVETMLAHLYAALGGHSMFDAVANNAYGSELNFRNRLSTLREIGCRHFQKHSDQALEGDLAWIIRHAEGYSQRRNDVAHGVVRFIDMVSDPRKTLLGSNGEWCLVPPHFRETKFTASNMPKYVLTSREINRLPEPFWQITRRTFHLARAVELPQHALRRRSAVPPPWPV